MSFANMFSQSVTCDGEVKACGWDQASRMLLARWPRPLSFSSPSLNLLTWKLKIIIVIPAM